MKKMGRYLWAMLAILLAAAPIVHAQDAPRILEHLILDGNAVLFVQGVPEPGQTPLCRIAGEQARVLSAGENTGTDTLFLIDVSNSINPYDQKVLQALMLGLIDGKPEGDRYAVMTFGEGMNLVCEMTADRWQISKSLEGLSYTEKGTGLYSTVAAALEMLKNPQEPLFQQIVIFSDGLEVDENGLTWEELSDLLKQNPIPITAFGFRHQDNPESLKAFYALARLTGGYYATIDTQTDLEQEAAAFLSFYDGMQRVVAQIPEKLLDGGSKPVGLLYSGPSGEVSAACDVRMPLADVPPESPSEPEPPAPSEPEPAAAPEPEPEQPGFLDAVPAPVIVGVPVAVAAVAALGFLLLGRRKRARAPARPAPPPEPPREHTQALGASDTQVLGGSSGHTQALINSQAFSNLVLIDTANPLKKFELTTQWEILAGRDPESCNIVLDYDKSISKKHCRIFSRDGKVYVCDLGSTNKTYVNGREAVGETLLSTGDVLKLGRLSFSVTIRG